MDEDRWVEIQAVLASSRPIEAYGGIALHPKVLFEMAKSLNSGRVPMSAEHDSRKPIRWRNVVAEVRKRPSGEYELFMTAEVVEEDWQLYQHMTGMSHTAIERIDNANWGKPVAIELSADAAWFDDDAVVEASRAMQTHLMNAGSVGSVGPGRMYQFSAVPMARAVIETSISLFNALGPNLLASAIWDGVKLLYARRHTPKGGNANAPTVVEIRLNSGQNSLIASVSTEDVDVARDAIAGLRDAISQFTFESESAVLDWDKDASRSDGTRGDWKRLK